MKYLIQFTNKSLKDIELHKKSGDKTILNKILFLLTEIANTPFEGTGKPEQLKHNLSGLWSRRISREHRLIYEIIDDKIRINSLYGHY